MRSCNSFRLEGCRSTGQLFSGGSLCLELNCNVAKSFTSSNRYLIAAFCLAMILNLFYHLYLSYLFAEKSGIHLDLGVVQENTSLNCDLEQFRFDPRYSLAPNDIDHLSSLFDIDGKHVDVSKVSSTDKDDLCRLFLQSINGFTATGSFINKTSFGNSITYHSLNVGESTPFSSLVEQSLQAFPRNIQSDPETIWYRGQGSFERAHLNQYLSVSADYLSSIFLRSTVLVFLGVNPFVIPTSPYSGFCLGGIPSVREGVMLPGSNCYVSRCVKDVVLGLRREEMSDPFYYNCDSFEGNILPKKICQYHGKENVDLRVALDGGESGCLLNITLKEYIEFSC